MRAMFVCSTGGHLSELVHWSGRLDPAPDSAVWVTHERANAGAIRAIDPSAEVHYVAPIEPKQAGVAAAMVGPARRLIDRTRPDVVISTGAAVALPFALAARARRIPCHYLESAARISAPSLTGRLVRRTAGAHPWCQAGPWRGWTYAGSRFDAFRPVPAVASGPPGRVVVALGTQANFGFRAAAEHVARALSGLAVAPEVLWQVGSTDVGGLDLTDPRRQVPEPELAAAMARADVVITHAGVGLAAMALDSGHIPVLVPRRSARAEHTDDHQRELADWLGGRGLAVPVEADAFTVADLARAQGGRASRRPDDELPRWVLADGPRPRSDAGRARPRRTGA